MKITILDTIPGEEDEIIIKCQNLSEDIQNPVSYTHLTLPTTSRV